MSCLKLPVLVLAGGRGERMRPLTETTPKCLLPVAGKPFALHQIELLHAQGLTDIVFSIGYLGEQVRNALGPLVQYSEAPDCGIQGAIHRANMTGPFYLLYGDVYPRYNATDLCRAYYRHYHGVMGRCYYYDTGFSLLAPDMQGIDFITVPPSLEIGSPEGYARMQEYFNGLKP